MIYKFKKFLSRLFKRNQWTFFGSYVYGEDDYIVYARMTNNGILKFKIKSVAGSFNLYKPILPHEVLDVKKQWGIITKQTKLI